MPIKELIQQYRYAVVSFEGHKIHETRTTVTEYSEKETS